MDNVWWRQYGKEAQDNFNGLMVAPSSQKFGVKKVHFNYQKNSGAGAIALGAHWGAKRIIMIGYDCQKTDGKAHWHKDHPGRMGNAGSIPKWPRQFKALRNALKGVDVINASRVTALDVFTVVPLEEALS